LEISRKVTTFSTAIEPPDSGTSCEVTAMQE